MTFIFAATTAICAVGWITARMATQILACYIAEKNYTPPSREEVKACSRKVVKKMLTKKKHY